MSTNCYLYSYSTIITAKKKKELQKCLAAAGNVALTTDVWTDRRQHAFLGVMVHTFDNGKPASNLLAFPAFRGSHAGQRIADELDSVINEFNLKEKL